MRKWPIFALLLGLIIFHSTANAQSGTKLKNISIELWSEYDQPSMLVIQEFVVAESTILPAEVTLRFPKNANLIGVAFNNAGELINADFEGPKEHGDWQIVILKVRSHDAYRIEYYQHITRDKNKRKFSFQWFGDYSVQEFNLIALIPLDSAEIVTSPILSRVSTTSTGLLLADSAGPTKLKMGQSYDFQIEYTRESEAVTNPSGAVNVQPVELVGSDTPGRVSINKLPWIIGGFSLGLIAVIFLLFSYWRSMQSSSSSNGLRKHRHRNEEAGSSQIYCHECGSRAHTGDRFCRTCGSKLRAES
jgi:hypothetical protein